MNVFYFNFGLTFVYKPQFSNRYAALTGQKTENVEVVGLFKRKKNSENFSKNKLLQVCRTRLSFNY